MTNKKLWEMQRRHRRLTERSKTIVSELRVDGASPLDLEAAEIIEWLLQGKAQLEKDFAEEVRGGQRDAQAAYAQGQQDQYDRDKERY